MVEEIQNPNSVPSGVRIKSNHEPGVKFEVNLQVCKSWQSGTQLGKIVFDEKNYHLLFIFILLGYLKCCLILKTLDY